jgi:hypothetical protein
VILSAKKCGITSPITDRVVGEGEAQEITLTGDF